MTEEKEIINPGATTGPNSKEGAEAPSPHSPSPSGEGRGEAEGAGETTKEILSPGDLKIKQFEERREALSSARKGEDVIAVIVPLDDLGLDWTVCYINKPSRTTVSLALSMIAASQPLQASEMIIREGWIEGEHGAEDRRVIDEDELMYAAHQTLQGLIKFRMGILKKN